MSWTSSSSWLLLRLGEKNSRTDDIQNLPETLFLEMKTERNGSETDPIQLVSSTDCFWTNLLVRILMSLPAMQWSIVFESKAKSSIWAQDLQRLLEQLYCERTSGCKD